MSTLRSLTEFAVGGAVTAIGGEILLQSGDESLDSLLGGTIASAGAVVLAHSLRLMDEEVSEEAQR